MATNYGDEKAKCPFYKTAVDFDISCEGEFRQSRLISRFTTKEARERVKQMTCDSDYSECPIYRMLDDKYRERIHIVIPLSPITKKNHQQIYVNRATGRPFISQSEQYKKYETDALLLLPKKRVEGKLNVRCVYYMPTRRKVDLLNLMEATMDILVKGGVLADDNSDIVISHDGSKVLYDKADPRTEITITKMED